MQTKRNLWLVAILTICSLILAACAAPNAAKVYCSKNPATVPAGQPVCRVNDNKINNNVEIEVPALQVGNQQVAIYYGYSENEKPIVIDNVGYHPYPASQAIIIPLSVLDFRTDSNSSGDFCKAQGLRCIDVIGNVTIVYTGADGQNRVVNNITIQVLGSLKFLVNDNTIDKWLTLNRVDPVSDFWSKFWDVVRVPKVIKINVDPVGDQWGTNTNQAVATVFNDRLANWEFADLFELTNGTIIVKSIDLPVTTSEEGASNASNVDAIATQAAVEKYEAESFATQRAVICQGISNDGACADLMNIYKGGCPNNGSEVTVQVEPVAPSSVATTTNQ